MKEFHTYRLPNGIRCIHKQIRSEVAYCALIVNAGARDELEHFGIAGDDLDVQAALTRAFAGDLPQRGESLRVDGLVAVGANRVACADDVHDAGFVAHEGRLGSGTRTKSLY